MLVRVCWNRNRHTQLVRVETEITSQGSNLAIYNKSPQKRLYALTQCLHLNKSGFKKQSQIQAKSSPAVTHRSITHDQGEVEIQLNGWQQGEDEINEGKDISPLAGVFPLSTPHSDLPLTCACPPGTIWPRSALCLPLRAAASPTKTRSSFSECEMNYVTWSKISKGEMNRGGNVRR